MILHYELFTLLRLTLKTTPIIKIFTEMKDNIRLVINEIKTNTNYMQDYHWKLWKNMIIYILHFIIMIAHKIIS